MISELYSKLHDPDYRRAFVASQINIGIPFQLRALLKASTWTQQELADKSDMLQPRISAMLKPGGAKFTLETLRRLAAAFDVGLIVKFVPFSELLRWSEDFDPEGFTVPTFEQEAAYEVSEGILLADHAEDIAPEITISELVAESPETHTVEFSTKSVINPGQRFMRWGAPPQQPLKKTNWNTCTGTGFYSIDNEIMEFVDAK